ncbi:hypothetical protein [Flavobacterium psychrophilum]|uniref:hypothetical protein n=1 Tax=Flavobacterium psychrophilum TaxID=96345 RepID=UPI001D077AB3|nr:hypothetical protein [Flavobacterium psychrophilum]MCB6099605.1 hypothetical protein [Flavobacterium psychrophilum]
MVIFKYLQLNIKEYSIFIEKLSSIPITQADIRNITSQAMLLEANKNVLNVLTSFIFFIDNAKTYLTRKYRNNEEVISEFKKLKSHHYDNSFAYRFLTKLRNYSIHMGLPLTGLGFDANLDTEIPEEMVGDVLLYVNIDALKKEKKLFAGMHHEVLNLKDDVDLRPLIQELSKSILEIQKFIYLVQMKHIEKCINYIEEISGKYKTETNDIKLYYVSKRINYDAELIVYDIPYDMINDFKKYKNSW